MKRYHTFYYSLTLVTILLFSGFHSFGQIDLNTESNSSKSCGEEVIDYLQSNYFDSLQNVVNLTQKSEHTIEEMLAACKKLSIAAQAIACEVNDLKTLPKPIILHLKQKHYILLTGYEDELFTIFDPAAKHLKSVSRNYLYQNYSGKAITFHAISGNFCKISSVEKNACNGSFMHEYPPPNEDDDGDDGGDDPENEPTGQCSNNRGGSPLFWFSPKNLNVIVKDVPMWYKPGIGPAIELKLCYLSNDHQLYKGCAAEPTEYFPFGTRWNFSFGSFYHTIDQDNIMIILPDGSRQTFVFDGMISSPVNLDYHNTFERYSVTNGYGYCLTIKNTKLKYRYDNPLHGKLTSIEDRNGNVIELIYNEDFNLSSIIDANVHIVNIELNESGKIIAATDPLGREASFEYGYTDDNFLVSITDMGGYTSSLSYDEVQILNQSGFVMESQIIGITTPTGLTTLDYSATGNVGPGSLGFTWTFTNPNGNSAPIEFYWASANTGRTRMYNNNGNYRDYYIDLQTLEILHIIEPDPDATIFYGYDEYGNRNSIIKGTYERTFVYDTTGNIIEFKDPRDNITFYEYDDNNNLIIRTDPMNRITSYDYDENSNLINITTTINSKIFEYFGNGNIKSYTDPNGNKTSFQYDSYGYLSLINFPFGNPTSFINDDVGRMIQKTENGVVIDYEYDDLNQLTKVVYPDGSSLQLSYDFQFLTEATDRGGRKSILSYDAMNQVVNAVSPQAEIKLVRDGKGNILDLSINGVITSYTYDEMDRLIVMTNPDGTSRYYTYDDLGNVLTRTDENGRLTTYYYDYYLLSQIDYSDDTPDVEYNYNNNRELTSIVDVNGTTDYSYDDGGRLILVDHEGSESDISYVYDSVGNRTSMSIPEMNVLYQYDELNRMISIASEFASADYQYNEDGLLEKRIYGNGTYTDYTYDNLNRLVSLQNTKSNGEIFSGFDYTFDASSMIKSIVDNEGNTYSYDYDNAYQLTEEKVEDAIGNILWHDKFTYDRMGNRLTRNRNGNMDYYTNNINNQLTALKKQVSNVSGLVYGDTTVKVFVNNIKAGMSIINDTAMEFFAGDIPLEFSTDTGFFVAYANGSIANVDDSSRFVVHVNKYPNSVIHLEITNDTTGVDPEYVNMILKEQETIHYTYDNNGNLIKRNSQNDTTEYIYDAENRLIKVELPGYYEAYEYDGFWQRTNIDINGLNNSTYLYDNLFQAVKITKDDVPQYLLRGLNLGGGIEGLIAIHNEKFETIYNTYNHRGDVIANINWIESVIFSTAYSAFGAIKNQSGKNAHGFNFSTKERNQQTGFSYFGYRYYSQETQRWISTDPIKFEGGLNFYRFVKNNPINYNDFFGLCVDQSQWPDEQGLVQVPLPHEYFTNPYKLGSTLIKHGIKTAIKKYMQGKISGTISGSLL